MYDFVDIMLLHSPIWSVWPGLAEDRSMCEFDAMFWLCNVNNPDKTKQFCCDQGQS